MEPNTVRNGHTEPRPNRGRDLAAASRATASVVEARLTADSGDRAGHAGPRVLVFVCPGLILGVEVAVTDDPYRLWVEGFLTPPPAAGTLVHTRGRDGIARAGTDADGRFTLTDIGPGPFSISLRPVADGPEVVTEWLVV